MLVFQNGTFHLNRLGNGNDNISSEEHFENSKPGNLLFEFIFEFYFITQSQSWAPTMEKLRDNDSQHLKATLDNQ
jgi:hypothetical protein